MPGASQRTARIIAESAVDQSKKNDADIGRPAHVIPI
jgi:hypothetical protein